MKANSTKLLLIFFVNILLTIYDLHAGVLDTLKNTNIKNFFSTSPLTYNKIQEKRSIRDWPYKIFGEFHFSDRYYSNLRSNTLDFNIHFENLKLDWRLVIDSINGLVRINDSYIINFECWHSIFKQSITLETTNIERFEIHHCSAVTLQSDWSDITNSFIIGESHIDNVEFSRVNVHSNVSIFADSINTLYFSLCDFDKDILQALGKIRLVFTGKGSYYQSFSKMFREL